MARTKKLYSKKKYYIKRRQRGGEIDTIEIPDFDASKDYASIQLGLIHKHSLSLHHNKMNLAIIANLNIDKNMKKYSV